MAGDDESGGLELPGGLRKRVGPLPVAGWLAAIVGGLGLAYVWNKRRGASEGTGSGDETTTDPSTAATSASAFLPTSFVVGGGGLPATGSTGGADVTGDGTTVDTPVTGYQTNSQWRNAAVSALIAKGYSAVIVDDAIARYLESQQLTAQQSAMVQQALQAVGPAPDPVPASPSPPPDPTQPASQPTPQPAPAPAAPAAPAAWVRPPWLAGVKFLIGDHGGAVYVITDQGKSNVPSEDALRAMGGGGTVNLVYPDGSTRPFTYGFPGTPPVAVPQSALDSIPTV